MQLAEDVNDKSLYHATTINSALKILKAGYFIPRAAVNSAEASASGSYPFFMSTARSLNSDYIAHFGTPIVVFVLDGEKIRKNYKVVPVSLIGDRRDNSSEMEERILTKKKTIPLGPILKEVYFVGSYGVPSENNQSMAGALKKYLPDIELTKFESVQRMIDRDGGEEVTRTSDGGSKILPDVAKHNPAIKAMLEIVRLEKSPKELAEKARHDPELAKLIKTLKVNDKSSVSFEIRDMGRSIRGTLSDDFNKFLLIMKQRGAYNSKQMAHYLWKVVKNNEYL